MIYSQEEFDVALNLVRKIRPYEYKKCTIPIHLYDNPQEQLNYKVVSLFLNTIFFDWYSTPYPGHIIQMLAKNNKLGPSPIPMATQSFQVDQDSVESSTNQLDSFDEDVGGKWAHTIVDGCEYTVLCDIEWRDHKKYKIWPDNRNRSVPIRLGFQVHRNYIDKINYTFINEAMELAINFCKQWYDEGSKQFVATLLKTYAISPQSFSNFLERLTQHEELLDEFIDVFIWHRFLPSKSHHFDRGVMAVKINNQTARDIDKKYELTPIGVYYAMMEMKEKKLDSIDVQTLPDYARRTNQ